MDFKRITKYDAFWIPKRLVFVDPDFNCRQRFTPQSVGSLADSILQKGLDFPVVVQRTTDMAQPPEGFEFRLVAGYRRFMAMVVNLQWEEIPATIREGMSDRDAEILNFTENLERKDLNPLEEAIAIRRLFPVDASLRTIAKAMNRDSHWVHQRLRILELPPELQHKVAAKILTLLDVDALIRLEPERRIEAANELIAARGKNKRKLTVNPEFRRKFRDRRGKEEVNARIGQMLEAGLQGLATRFGAWFAGYISDDELDADIELAIQARKSESKRGRDPTV